MFAFAGGSGPAGHRPFHQVPAVLGFPRLQPVQGAGLVLRAGPCFRLLSQASLDGSPDCPAEEEG